MLGSPRMVFDPGVYISPDLHPFELDALEVISELFKVDFPQHSGRCPVVVQGEVQIEEDFEAVDHILFDSGAMQASYISKEWVNNNRYKIKKRLRACRGQVKLADNQTVVDVSERYRTIARFTLRGSGEVICGVVDFWVLDMPGPDGVNAIIGLPDILKSFLSIFVEMLEDASTMIQQGECMSVQDLPVEQHILNSMSLEQLKEAYPDLVDCWSKPIGELAEEELETEEPCSFTGPLYYLSKPYDEVRQEYFDMFDKHLAPSWRNHEGLLELLHSEKARKVFTPEAWAGISDLVIEFDFDENMPKAHKDRARPLNPKLREATEAEFKRMMQYMYVPSDSPIACPLVVAPKATYPFIRICGDYIWINKWIRLGQYYIPLVMKELEKAAGFRYYMDIDLTNAFHQLPLGKKTSEMLSVVTPWGTVRPLYLPEGVSPGSGKLQTAVMEIFADMSDWTIVLFDNLLVLCDDLEDGVAKLHRVIDRCYERNVVLKFAKSWLGFTEVKFFGYKVHAKTDENEGHYGLDEERKSTVSEMKMPTSTKAMQRFLGTALFFSEFIPCYADRTRLLYDMTKNGFVWDPTFWTENYFEAFNYVKECLCRSVEKYFPDYALNWILRVDASDTAVGAVLLQIRIINGKEIHQPIGFKSHKFSGAALNWDAHKKEAYALYFGTKSFAYYLRGKPFILETDHSNLQYIEKSEVPIIIRWRVYMQSFMLVLRHIKGKHNTVADWASRLYRILVEVCESEQVDMSPSSRLYSIRSELRAYLAPQGGITGEAYTHLGDGRVDLVDLYRAVLQTIDDDVAISPALVPQVDGFEDPSYRMSDEQQRPIILSMRDYLQGAGNLLVEHEESGRNRAAQILMSTSNHSILVLRGRPSNTSTSSTSDDSDDSDDSTPPPSLVADVRIDPGDETSDPCTVMLLPDEPEITPAMMHLPDTSAQSNFPVQGNDATRDFFVNQFTEQLYALHRPGLRRSARLEAQLETVPEAEDDPVSPPPEYVLSDPFCDSPIAMPFSDLEPEQRLHTGPSESCDPVECPASPTLTEFVEAPSLVEQGTQTADDTDILVPRGATVVNIPLPAAGTRWAGGDWCVPCGNPREPRYYIRFVHNAGSMHFGARRTYRRLKHFFPGSKIPYSEVRKFIADCPRCQANPIHWTADIKPIVRTLIPEDFRTRIGIDTLKVSPRDIHGNCVVVVIVNLKTKLVFLFPASNELASTIATAIIQFITTYGLVDEIVSDPGRNITSKLVQEVNEWLGLRHFVSLVDVHTSNGVECTNRESMRHLRTLVNDERLQPRWSEVKHLALIQYALNERIHSETGYSAFELTFGSADAKYFRVSDARDPQRTATEWLHSLNASLQAIREITTNFQNELIAERMAANPQGSRTPVHATYSVGDLVMYDSLYTSTKRRAVKLANRALGPYRVVGQNKNDVTCRHLCTGVVSVFAVERLTLFTGTPDQADRLALEDADQEVIEGIDGWRGDPEHRRTMEFFVKFRTNQDYVWEPWSEDLSASIPFEQYCIRYPAIRRLVYTSQEVREYATQLNSQPIATVEPGVNVYVSLRYFDIQVHDERCDLPNKFGVDYVVKMCYTRWDREDHTRIEGVVPVFGDAQYTLTAWFVEAWGSREVLLPSMREITTEYFIQYTSLFDFVPLHTQKNVRKKVDMVKRQLRLRRPAPAPLTRDV